MTRLGDVCTKIGSGATPRGGKEVYRQSGIPLIRSQNVLDWSFSENGLAFIDDKQAAALANAEVQPNDVLVNITGDSVTRACMVPGFYTPARVNQHVAILRPSEKLDPVFLLCLIQLLKPKLLRLASSGATRNALTKGMLESLEIELPSLSQQQAIAGIIGGIQSKIILNIRINDYLEEQCDAIFSAFLQPEEGSAWHVGTLNELLEVKYGKDHKQLDAGPYPVYGSGGYMRSVDRYLSSGESVLIPRKGSLNNVMYVNEEFWTVDTMFFTVPRKRGAAKYAYQHLKTLDLASMNSGSAVPSMTTDILNGLQLPIPNDEGLAKFDETLQPAYSLIQQSKSENTYLGMLRDALLPKLMSGEVDVSKIDITQLNNHLVDC